MISFMYPVMFISLLLAMLCGAQPPKNIFLLAGQSNMSGRGGVFNISGKWVWDGVIPPKCEPNPAIFRFTANHTWEEAREPLHRGIDIKMPLGVGPGMPFANSLLKLNFSVGTIGLVPCAIGGSALKEWEKEGGQYYAPLIDRARNSTIGGGVIKALLWYQGETDAAGTKSTAETYGERFKKFLSDVRNDLRSPDLPVIQVAIDWYQKFSRTVRKAQLGLRVPNVKCVDAFGLPLEADKLHLTTMSQVILGEEMALKYLIHF